MSYPIIQGVQIANVQCNFISHQGEAIKALCLHPECQQNSFLCSKCLIKDHLQCQNFLCALEVIPKELIELRQLSLAVLILQEKINHQFKELLSRIEQFLMPISQYQDSPNLTNLNEIGLLLRKKNYILQTIDETKIQIKGLLQNHNLIEELKEKAKESYNEGWNLYKNCQYKEAIKYFNTAIQMDQNNSEYQYWKGMALLNLGKSQESIEFFNKAIHINLNNADYQYSKGRALLNQDISQAIKCFDKTLQINPNHTMAKLLLQKIKGNSNQHNE